MKDPALHIRRSNLSSIFVELGIDVKFIPAIMEKAIKYSIKNRVVVTTKSKGKKKSDRHIESDTNLVDQFNRIYSETMLTNNIKTLTITRSSIQYLTLKEVCYQALEFSKMFNLEAEKGFKLYVDIGVKLLGRTFSLYRLKGNANKIVEWYRDDQIIINDPSPNKTTGMVIAWSEAVKKYFSTTLTINSKDLAHFVHAKNDAESVKASSQDWIDAQFEKWSYLNIIPQFTQLYGDNAKLIYEMYMAKTKKTNKKEFFKKPINEQDIPTKAAEQAKIIREARIHKSVESTGSENAG